MLVISILLMILLGTYIVTRVYGLQEISIEETKTAASLNPAAIKDGRSVFFWGMENSNVPAPEPGHNIIIHHLGTIQWREKPISTNNVPLLQKSSTYKKRTSHHINPILVHRKQTSEHQPKPTNQQ